MENDYKIEHAYTYNSVASLYSSRNSHYIVSQLYFNAVFFKKEEGMDGIEGSRARCLDEKHRVLSVSWVCRCLFPPCLESPPV